MIDGTIKLENIIIRPNSNTEIMNVDEFNVIKIDTGEIYVSKKPMELMHEKFWANIFCDKGKISKIELSNADEKFKMNYQTMTEETINELRKHNDDFLIRQFGIPSKKHITGLEYCYAWGKALSYYDNKSSEAGILIIYF